MSVDAPGPIPPLQLEPSDPKRERRRRRRERSRATADPAQEAARETSRSRAAARETSRARDVAREAAREAARARKRLIGRSVAVLVLLGIAGAAVVPITLWSRYQTAYVTSSNAAVKGSITQVGGQISGVVASVEVEPGQHVTAGQVLARFEDHQLQANVLRAKSRLTEAMARSSSAQSRIEAAQTQSEEAKVRRDQRIGLAASGAIAQDELRAAETRLKTTEALERTAIADHNESGAQVATAEAELALARADLEAAVIRAPADGRVVRRISEPGASVVVGQPVVALWIGKDVWVEAWIDEDLLSKVTVGSDVKVTVNSFPGRVFHGKVESIGVSTDFELPEGAVPQSRSERMRNTPVVPVRIRLDDREGLFPGLSAVVAIRRTGAMK
jgi:membrane fusion protein, multidrug efflux system